MQIFYSNLKLLREKSLLNQAQIAEKMGISRSRWNNYETGTSRPNLEDFIEIAKYFGVTETDLLHNESLTEGYVIPENRVKSEPKSKPKGKPNDKNEPILNNSQEVYGLPEMAKNKDETIAALKKVVSTQEALIQALSEQLKAK